jgi:hypothetical protein
MPVKKPGADSGVIVVPDIQTQTLDFALIGETPLILNRMSRKSAHELLMPRGPKNAAQRQAELKHDPYEEYRASAYRFADDDSPTLLAMMSSAIKGAMMTASLDLPGTKKAQIGRLVYVEGDLVPVWGVPKLFMSITRSADMNRTPDVRTRAIVPIWAALVSVRFVRPILNERAITNLLSAGGTTAGVGDWRAEKGKGSYGQFRIANTDDPLFVAITETAGRAVQLDALDNPMAYDAESAELLTWFDTEVVARGKRPAPKGLAVEVNGREPATARAG